MAVGKPVKHSGTCLWVAANEFISGTLGTFIGLPIPPFVMLQPRPNAAEQTKWFASLDYRLAGEDMPPIDPAEVYAEAPEICAGVIVFDLWIANMDRYDRNLSFDRTTTPKRLNVIDHGHALFGINGGTQRLISLLDKFTLNEDVESGANRHCLIDQIDDFYLFKKWTDRINGLPAFQIEDACNQALELGIIDPGERDSVLDFLLRRRNLLGEMLLKNWEAFTSVTTKPMNL